MVKCVKPMREENPYGETDPRVREAFGVRRDWTVFNTTKFFRLQNNFSGDDTLRCTSGSRCAKMQQLVVRCSSERVNDRTTCQDHRQWLHKDQQSCSKGHSFGFLGATAKYRFASVMKPFTFVTRKQVILSQHSMLRHENITKKKRYTSQGHSRLLRIPALQAKLGSQ